MNDPSLQQKYDDLLDELEDERENSKVLLRLLEETERELVQARADLINLRIDNI